MDLSKRANLLGVREVRGLVLADPASPTGMLGADWTDFVSMRADDAEDPNFWVFRGKASVVEHAYTVRDMWGEYAETMAEGSFDKTRAENPDVMLNYMHDPVTTMVTTRSGGLKLPQDARDLDVEAMVPKDDLDAQRVMPKVQRGDAASMSYAFRVMRQEWNEDYTERRILEVNLHRGDVAVIVTGLGANPAAYGTVRAVIDFDAVLRYLEASENDAEFDRVSAIMAARSKDPAELDPEFLKELVAVQLRGRTP